MGEVDKGELSVWWVVGSRSSRKLGEWDSGWRDQRHIEKEHCGSESRDNVN